MCIFIPIFEKKPKETELTSREKQVQEIQEELTQLKEAEKAQSNDNQQMTAELSEVKVELEKVSYDSKESAITVDSLKEANEELTAELQELRKTLAQVRESVEKEQQEEQKASDLLRNASVSALFLGELIMTYLTSFANFVFILNQIMYNNRVRSMKNKNKYQIHLETWEMSILKNIQ